VMLHQPSNPMISLSLLLSLPSVISLYFCIKVLRKKRETPTELKTVCIVKMLGFLTCETW
jgi:hypothetical protein